jgi:hypothetical protein
LLKFIESKMKIKSNNPHGEPIIYFGNHQFHTGMLSNRTRRLLDALIAHMNEADNQILLPEKEFTSSINYSIDTISFHFNHLNLQSGLAELEDNGLIKTIAPNTYIVNRNFFRKASDIKSLMSNYDKQILALKVEISRLKKVSTVRNLE